MTTTHLSIAAAVPLLALVAGVFTAVDLLRDRTPANTPLLSLPPLLALLRGVVVLALPASSLADCSFSSWTSKATPTPAP